MNPVETSLPPISAASPHAPRVAASGRTHSPTRETLLRLIEAQTDPVTIARLAAASGCHENTVRGHVHALWRDGFLDRELAPVTGQGRPSWLWRAIAADPASPYAGLAMALADGLAATGADAPDRARAVGLKWGRTLAAQLPPATTLAEARRTVFEVMQEQGFAPRDAGVPEAAASTSDAAAGEPLDPQEPRVQQTPQAPQAAQDHQDRQQQRILLRRCPLVAAATHRPEIVCAVHLGMVAGALEAIGAADDGSTLTPMSGPGECTLDLRVRS